MHFFPWKTKVVHAIQSFQDIKVRPSISFSMHLSRGQGLTRVCKHVITLPGFRPWCVLPCLHNTPHFPEAAPGFQPFVLALQQSCDLLAYNSHAL